MPALKSRRSKLLLVAIVIAVLILWKPWEGIQPNLRGIRTGADILKRLKPLAFMAIISLSLDSFPNTNSAAHKADIGIV